MNQSEEQKAHDREVWAFMPKESAEEKSLALQRDLIDGVKDQLRAIHNHRISLDAPDRYSCKTFLALSAVRALREEIGHEWSNLFHARWEAAEKALAESKVPA